ncbi:MAG: DUF1476 domain-containing protein [Hyphomicrobiaceae bacterium]|nr:DUF1476 domain-containing protein [Hyphomicrobiaceae bacterium]
MTGIQNRQKAFEDKFARDADLKFKAEARRNKLLAQWAGAKMGVTGEALDAYIKEVRKADLAAAGDDDVFQKVKADFAAKGTAVSDAELRKHIDEFLAEAVRQIEAGE